MNRPILSSHQTRFIKKSYGFYCEKDGDGTIIEYNMTYQYCPYCGRKIVEFVDDKISTKGKL